jgi:hypothetical protein
MAQNVQHWLFDRDRYTWAREHVPVKKWFQITKYFPGYRLRRQMMYVDAETGEPIAAEGGEIVPAGRVYLYGYDLRNFCGLDVPGLDAAMTARPPSRVERARAAAEGHPPGAPPVRPPASSPGG